MSSPVPGSRGLRVSSACVAVIAATTIAGGTARAENDPDASSVLFEEASRAASAKDFATCVEKASAAWEKFQHAQIRGLQGMCEVELGKHAVGATHLAAYIRNSASDVEPQFKAAFARARERVAELELACEPRGATIYVDGEPVGLGPATVFVDPGERRIGARMRGYVNGEKTQTFAAGSVTQVKIILESVPEHAAPSEPFPAWPGIVGLAAGGVTAVVGIGLLVAAGSEGAAIEEDGRGLVCDPAAPTGRCATIRDDLDARDTMGNVGVGVLVGGLVVFGAGAVLTSVAFASGPDTPDAKGKQSAFAIVPMVGAVNGLSLRVELR